VLRLTAPWILPIASPPVADGAMLVDASGRIAAVGPREAVPVPPDAEQRDLPGCVLMPGLVNAHTHLELTGLAGTVEEDDFAAWIARIITVKAARREEAFYDAAVQGIRECWRQGVTTICDTGSTGQVIAALDALGGSGIVHHEVFGMHPDDCAPAIRAFSRDLDRLARHATGRVALGLSPHAPYTVSGALYRASAELARAHGAPMAVHVAEPLDESLLLRDFSGRFAELWRARGVPAPANRPFTPVEWLEEHGVLGERTLCIHVIHADDADVSRLVRHRCAVAHCPRSNRRHHHADAPVRAFLDAGLRVGLGTDSEVSVAPIDLLAEARAARALAGWTAAETVRALTLGGAEALGLDRQVGALVTGYTADLVAIPVASDDAPEGAVLGWTGNHAAATWLGGRLVHGALDGGRPLYP
jgi:cytosine/adenosine deaminase-related metal-dependent hydrolase